jgi:hypothetical protein
MNTKDRIIKSPEINAEFKDSGSDTKELVISDEQYAQLSEVTNSEQIAKLRCWDIQEYIDGVEAQKSQLDTALDSANEQLEEAKSNLIQARTQLKSTFDVIFGPLGLDNKMVSVSQSSPHVVTIVDPQAAAEQSTSEESSN